MDFTVTDIYGYEKGYLEHCGAEVEVGTENDFEVKVQNKLYDVEKHGYGCRVFAENTEYGGLIRVVNPVTEDKIVKLKGPTWRGILAQRAINPDSNDYIYLDGEANSVLARLIVKLDLSEIFEVSNLDSGFTFNKYKVPLQGMLLEVLTTALDSIGARLDLKYKLGDSNDRGYVLLEVKPVKDYSEEIEISEDGNVKLNIKDDKNGVNHLICYGQGEGLSRQRVDLYAWPDGSIRKEQYYIGVDLIEQYYEDTSAETIAELEESGREKLEELKNSKQLRISVSDMDLELGDIIGGRERITGIYMAAPVVRKIVTTTGKGRTSIEYKLRGEE